MEQLGFGPGKKKQTKNHYAVLLSDSNYFPFQVSQAQNRSFSSSIFSLDSYLFYEVCSVQLKYAAMWITNKVSVPMTKGRQADNVCMTNKTKYYTTGLSSQIIHLQVWHAAVDPDHPELAGLLSQAGTDISFQMFVIYHYFLRRHLLKTRTKKK